jgi:hypothetical protein
VNSYVRCQDGRAARGTYGVHRAEYDRYSVVMARQQKKISEMQEKLDSTRAYQKTLAEGAEATRLHLEAVKRQIQGIPALKQTEEAEAESDRQGCGVQIPIRSVDSIDKSPGAALLLE